MGANKELKTDKELKKLRRGAMDWRVDANSGITVIRWYNNGLVQLASSYLGNQNGNNVIRWSANENKKIEIERPAIVQECNAHIHGVDLRDMLLALYRVRVRSTKFYMRIVYYCMGVAITNGWLIYRKFVDQNKILKKKQMNLCTFQSRIAKALLLGKKEK